VVSGCGVVGALCTPALLVVRGTTTQSSDTTVQIPVSVGSSASKSKQVALTLANGIPTFSACGPVNGGSFITVLSGGLLNILACSNPACTCVGAAPQIAYRITTSAAVPALANVGLVLKSGGTLQFNEVGNAAGFGILQIDGTAWSFEAGSSIVCQLTAQLAQTAFSVPIMYYAIQGANGCQISAAITVTPSVFPRTIDSHCIVAGGYNILYLDIGAATALNTNQETNTFQFTTSSLYSVTLNKVCGQYGGSNFVSDVVSSSLTGRTATTAGQLSIVGTVCGSVIITFQCLSSTSPQDATNLCQTIVSDAITPGTSLNAKVQGTTGGAFVVSSNSSNTALYALFALLAIPVICVIGICLVVRAKQREADNQYMQDTATFSNVAATPQPLGVHPGYLPQMQPY